MDKARFVQLQVQMQDAFARLSDAIYEMARAETYEWAMTKVLAAVFSQDPMYRPKEPAGEAVSAGEAVPAGGTMPAGGTVPAGEASAGKTVPVGKAIFVRKTVPAGETASAERIEASKETLYTEYNEAQQQWRDRVRKAPAKPESVPKQRIIRPRMPRAVVHCPVPGCEGVAAPVFGMVCSLHKDMPRAKIVRYFKQRRDLKAKLFKSASYGRPKAGK